MLVKRNSLMQPFLPGSPGGRGVKGDGKAKRISDEQWVRGFPECKHNALLDVAPAVVEDAVNAAKPSETPRCYVKRSETDDCWVGLCDAFPGMQYSSPSASLAHTGIVAMVGAALDEVLFPTYEYEP